MGRLHSYGAVEPQQRTELVLNDSANVGTAHYCEGRDSFWKSPLSSGGGEVSFLYVCFIIYTCLLLRLRLIWDTLYSMNSTENLVTSPMYDGDDATSDFPSLLLRSVSTNLH